ncbi:MAG: SDR family NAD(P)-dependent oxidoreductase [Cyclobacteriaceae bacterium]|nr:SDR family NAD(P)-dependent oxidoreductase [Cyclobacteriaceae bacterium HetDA_MAG_MS6]
MSNKVILITGVSGGLGRNLAEVAAKQGHTVIGSLRKEQQFADFEGLVPGKTFPIKLDVTSEQDRQNAIQSVIDTYGQMDVLINNAGFGLIGAAEEFSEEEARQQFETNFWGAALLTAAILPHMRERGTGNIIQISAIGGFVPVAGMAYYGASKIALEGLSDSLAAEVAPFGIKVMAVLPGPMRTNWAGSSLKSPKKQIAAYDDTVGKFKGFLASIDGKQPWSPYKTAEAILEAAFAENAPFRFFVGDYALENADKQLRKITDDLDNWRSLAQSTKIEEEATV